MGCPFTGREMGGNKVVVFVFWRLVLHAGYRVQVFVFRRVALHCPSFGSKIYS
jgi:hypothetical protein